MAKKVQLKDRITNESVYPITIPDNIIGLELPTTATETTLGLVKVPSNNGLSIDEFGNLILEEEAINSLIEASLEWYES